MSVTKNFLGWYKLCCENDSTIYRKTVYSLKKAKIFYSLGHKHDYAIYPLDGTEKFLSGSREFCENIIQNEINMKFFVFDFINDKPAQYYCENNTIHIET